jgi:hypothetical protein
MLTYQLSIITDILRDNPYSMQFRSLGNAKNILTIDSSWTLTKDAIRELTTYQSSGSVGERKQKKKYLWQEHGNNAWNLEH